MIASRVVEGQVSGGGCAVQDIDLSSLVISQHVIKNRAHEAAGRSPGRKEEPTSSAKAAKNNNAQAHQDKEVDPGIVRVPNPRTTQEDYAAAKMKIKKWTELASDDGLDALNPRDLPENMRELAKAKQAAASTIEDGLRLQAEATCEDLDKIIELKKYKEQENYQILRAFIDGDITPRAEDMSDPLTSSLEKKRTRIMNEFHQAIKKQQALLAEI